MKTKRVIAVLLLLVVGCGIAFGAVFDLETGERIEQSREELEKEFLEQGIMYFRVMRIVVIAGLVIGI